MNRFENSTTVVDKSDFSDFRTFLKTFLNTSDACRRKEIAEEFRKRHLELHEFLKENGELVSAETEISDMIRAVISEEKTDGKNNNQVSNLLEMIEKSAENGLQ